MDCFNSIINDIITYLSGDKNLSDIIFLRSYPLCESPSPIDTPHITIGFMGIGILKRMFSDYIGELSGASVCGRQAIINLGIKIYGPKRLGGEGCIEVFERVCDSLMFGQKNYIIESIECGKIDYDFRLTSINLFSNIKMNTFIKSEKSLFT